MPVYLFNFIEPTVEGKIDSVSFERMLSVIRYFLSAKPTMDVHRHVLSHSNAHKNIRMEILRNNVTRHLLLVYGSRSEQENFSAILISERCVLLL